MKFSQQKGKQSQIIVTSKGSIETAYLIREDMDAVVAVGDEVKAKTILAKIPDQKQNVKSKVEGKVSRIEDGMIHVESHGAVEKVYPVPLNRTVIVSSGHMVKKGEPLTNGHLNLKQLMELTDEYTVQKYIMTEVQSIYASQGQSINDKHIEIIARQMLSKIRILDGGDSELLPGEIVDIIKFTKINNELKAAGKKVSRGERLLLGLTRIALYTDSWLSAASFQETIRVLVEASTTSKIDQLEGLKENVIIGKLIPAGATYRRKNHMESEEDKIREVIRPDKKEEKLPII